MSRNYKFQNKSGLYFVSFATVNWIDVFTRQLYFSVLTDSINYCRAEKGMELYCYCFMPSHVHFIFRSTNEQPSELLRDFKRHTPLIEECFSKFVTSGCNKIKRNHII